MPDYTQKPPEAGKDVLSGAQVVLLSVRELPTLIYKVTVQKTPLQSKNIVLLLSA
jgi:hypothetical protein